MLAAGIPMNLGWAKFQQTSVGEYKGQSGIWHSQYLHSSQPAQTSNGGSSSSNFGFSEHGEARSDPVVSVFLEVR